MVAVVCVVAELTVTARSGRLGEFSDNHKGVHWINFDVHSLMGILVFVPKLGNFLFDFGSKVLSRTEFFKAGFWFCYVSKQLLLVSVSWVGYFFSS